VTCIGRTWLIRRGIDDPWSFIERNWHLRDILEHCRPRAVDWVRALGERRNLSFNEQLQNPKNTMLLSHHNYLPIDKGPGEMWVGWFFEFFKELPVSVL
jgi:hypothetical protein